MQARLFWHLCLLGLADLSGSSEIRAERADASGFSFAHLRLTGRRSVLNRDGAFYCDGRNEGASPRIYCNFWLELGEEDSLVLDLQQDFTWGSQLSRRQRKQFS